MEASQASSVAQWLELGSHNENGYSIHPPVHSIVVQHFAWHRGYRVAWGTPWPPAAPAIGHKEAVSPGLGGRGTGQRSFTRCAQDKQETE